MIYHHHLALLHHLAAPPLLTSQLSHHQVLSRKLHLIHAQCRHINPIPAQTGEIHSFQVLSMSLIKWCHCPVCGSYDITPLWTTTSSQLSLILVCESCDKSSKWSSQPYIGAFPAGNILLSAGILFAGASAGKVLRVLNSIGVNTHSTRTFCDHQTTILQPAIKTVWEQEQQSRLKVGPLFLEEMVGQTVPDIVPNLEPTHQWTWWTLDLKE